MKRKARFDFYGKRKSESSSNRNNEPPVCGQWPVQQMKQTKLAHNLIAFIQKCTFPAHIGDPALFQNESPAPG